MNGTGMSDVVRKPNIVSQRAFPSSGLDDGSAMLP